MNNLPLEVIFDYACPYCYRAHLYLQEIRDEYPRLQMQFRPCEAHPRPEQRSPHSDLALKGMYYALEQKADIWKYHDLIYRAFHVDRINAEDIDCLAGYLSGLFDAEAFKAAMNSKKYDQEPFSANQYAWESLALTAVPSYCMGEHVLKAAEGIGVSKEMLVEFLTENGEADGEENG